MSRPRNRKRPARRTRKSRRRGAVHLVRGLVLEGLGVAVLAFLYFSMQSTTMSRASHESPAREVDVVESQPKDRPADTLRHGQYARSWAEYHRQTRSQRSFAGSSTFSIGSMNTVGY